MRAFALAAAASLAGAKLNDQRELASAVLGITMQVPPAGQATAITGKVTALGAWTYSNYKVSILTSGDGGVTWWDKSHGPYRNHQLADPSYNPAQAQGAGVVIQSDGSFTLANYQASPNDATSDLWVAFVVPQSYDMTYPNYQIEGVAIRPDLLAAELAWTVVSKTRGTLSIGSGPFPGVGGGNGAAAASPAASPAAGAPAASPAADASPAAAAPSTAALPAGSTAPAADGTTQTSGAASVTAALSAAAAAVVAAYVLA